MEVGMRKIARIALGSLVFFTCVMFIYRPGRASSTLSSSIEQEKRLTVIFDLGGVIFDTHKTRTFWHLGPKALFYYWHGKRKNTRTIKDVFYSTLNNISGTTSNRFGARDDEEILIPELLCDWLTGTKTTQELRAVIAREIKQHAEWFESNAEKQLALRMTRIVFTPEIFAHTRKVIKETVDFVKECKEKGHRLIVLSNWDPESFPILVKKHTDIFELFDDIVISGHMGTMKPDYSVYGQITQGLPLETYVLIDDQKENLRAAKSCGIHGILCKKKSGMLGSGFNLTSMRRKLNKIEERNGLLRFQNQTSQTSPAFR